MLTGDHSVYHGSRRDSHADRISSDAQRYMQSPTHAPRHMCAHHTHMKIKLFTLKRGRERMFALNTTRSENLGEKKTNGVFP